MQKAATVFVSYLSSQYVSLTHSIALYPSGVLRVKSKTRSKGLTNPSANDATLKRTVAPSDVFTALSELEFDSFRSKLEQELEAYTEIKAGVSAPEKVEAASVPDALPELLSASSS